jgi:uncharacterized membrane protein
MRRSTSRCLLAEGTLHGRWISDSSPGLAKSATPAQCTQGVEAISNLIAAAAFFILFHRGVSGSRLRGRAVDRLGVAAYARLFGLVSIGALVWLGFAYAGAGAGGMRLWPVPPAVAWLQWVLQPIACLFVIAGLTTRNPATFGQEAVADAAEPVWGMLRVTRHPFLWGIGVFAIGHLLTTPTPRGLVLFGSLAFVALTGTRSIDAKRRRSMGSKWLVFEAQTSNLPFAAIVAGRQRFRWRELGWWRPGLSVSLAALLGALHP